MKSEINFRLIYNYAASKVCRIWTMHTNSAVTLTPQPLNASKTAIVPHADTREDTIPPKETARYVIDHMKGKIPFKREGNL